MSGVITAPLCMSDALQLHYGCTFLLIHYTFLVGAVASVGRRLGDSLLRNDRFRRSGLSAEGTEATLHLRVPRAA